MRSIDELSGRTTGRLGDIRPDTAHAIGGTAELALRYSLISALTAGPKRYSVMVMGRPGAAGACATPPHPPGPQDRLRDYGPARAADAAAESAGAAGPFRDYGPAGSSGRRRRRRRTAVPFRGTTGRTDPPVDYAGVHHGKNNPEYKQADDSTTRPSGSGSTRQSDALDSESSSTCQCPTRPGPGTF